jgi:crotonobetainyl-CoA:carnitine CoA-transferase CaiB-like acyl-CoA transferase
MVLFDGKGRSLAPPPLAGQHNEELLLERAYDAEHIARLEADGVLWHEDLS